MNILENILKEIKTLKGNQNSTNQDFATGYLSALSTVEGIIVDLDHNVDVNKTFEWIPVTERLPEEHDTMFAKYKGTNKWHDAMFEKISDNVNVTVELEDGTRKTTTTYTVDGKWKAEIEMCIVKKKVVAWMPLPKEYKGE